jgi:hypothetical protein
MELVEETKKLLIETAKDRYPGERVVCSWRGRWQHWEKEASG